MGTLEKGFEIMTDELNHLLVVVKQNRPNKPFTWRSYKYQLHTC